MLFYRQYKYFLLHQQNYEDRKCSTRELMKTSATSLLDNESKYGNGAADCRPLEAFIAVRRGSRRAEGLRNEKRSVLRPLNAFQINAFLHHFP